LGNLESGSMNFDTKVKSFQQHWFQAKPAPTKPHLIDDGDYNGEEELYIERYTLIKFYCKQGKMTMIENCIIICPFTKYYNKRYVSIGETEFCWKKGDKSTVCGSWLE
jgi:hypothetical protein